MMRANSLMLLAVLLNACASQPPLRPLRAEPLAATPLVCAAPAAEAATAATPATLVPGGIAVVHSGGREVLILAGRGCVLTLDTASGAAETLPTRGDSIAPTMVHATAHGVVFSSSLSGSVRAINPEGAVLFNVSGLRMPLGVRLLPGGAVLTAEHGAGRVLRLGPSEESRPRSIAEGLDGPVGIAVVDATRAVVTESIGGRLTEIRLDRFEKRTIADGLKRPEGVTLMADGRVAVVEAGLGRVIAVKPADGAIEVLADGLSTEVVSAEGKPDPLAMTDIAAASGGVLFVSAPANGTVLRLAPRSPPPAP